MSGPPLDGPRTQVFSIKCANRTCDAEFELTLAEGLTPLQCAACKTSFAVHVQRATNPQPYSGAQPTSFTVTAHGIRKKKQKRDPNAPPRMPTAYNLFMKDEVVNVKKDNPQMAHKDAFRLAAERWASSDKNPNKGKVTGVELEVPIEAIAQPHAHDESDSQMVQPIHNPMAHALHSQDPMPM